MWNRNNSVFGLSFIPNTGKYGLEIIPYLDTFHAVFFRAIINTLNENMKSQFQKLDACAYVRDDVITYGHRIGKKYHLLTN